MVFHQGRLYVVDTLNFRVQVFDRDGTPVFDFGELGLSVGNMSRPKGVATGGDELCVYCHTPHGATAGATPLWNRDLSGATYVPYQSSSLDATGIGQPGGTSKLCLSCHDGTMP